MMNSEAVMNAIVDISADVVPPRRGSTGRRMVAGMVLPALAAVIAVIGLRVPASATLPSLQAVAFGLVLVGALSGVILARAPDRVAQWQVAFGALTASVALTAARIGDEVSSGQHRAARAVATLAVPFIIAISFHLLLALPDGRLRGHGRGSAAGRAYAPAAGAGIVLVIVGRPVPAAAVALAWPLALASALPAVRLRYLAVAGRARDSMPFTPSPCSWAGGAPLPP